MAIGAAAALTVMAVAALVPPLDGTAVAAERIDPAAGAPVSVHVVDGFESGDDLLAAAVFGDLQTFWGTQLPRLGIQFEALRGGYASVNGSGSGTGALCVSPASTLLGNAYYCRADDGIVYDSAALVPVLLDQYGTAGLTASLAHEFGHAVQARLAAASGSQASSPAILQEAQADCDAGAFLAWLVAAHGGSVAPTRSSAGSTDSEATGSSATGPTVTGSNATDPPVSERSVTDSGSASATVDPEPGAITEGTVPAGGSSTGPATATAPVDSAASASGTGAPTTSSADSPGSAPPADSPLSVPPADSPLSVPPAGPSATASPDQTGPSVAASPTPAPSGGATEPGLEAITSQVAPAELAGAHVAVQLPADSLLRAVTPLMEFRDPVDTEVTGPQAHGLGLDRLRAALAGIRGGAAACPALTMEGLDLTEGQIRGVDTSKARFASNHAVDDAAIESVRSFDPTALPENGSTRANPDDLLAAAPFGQFARAAATALAAGTARFGAGRPTAAACYLGAWTGFVYGKADDGQLGSWPGDADEAMDMLRSRPGATFEELAAFATGFDDGLPSCD